MWQPQRPLAHTMHVRQAAIPGMHLLTQGPRLDRSMHGVPCSATESMSKPRCGLPLLRLRPRRPSACARPGSDTADVRSRWLSLSRLRDGLEWLW